MVVYDPERSFVLICAMMTILTQTIRYSSIENMGLEERNLVYGRPVLVMFPWSPEERPWIP